MARTPIFRFVARQFAIARAARSAGVPPVELAEMRTALAPPLSRRRFLQIPLVGAGAAALGSLAPGCRAQPVGAGRGPRVAIVGAGIAGLHCAHRLARAGLRATVYESSERIGGRIFTDRTTFGPRQHCELGGELIDSGHATMHALARELDIALLDYRTDDPALATLTAHIGGAILTPAQILDGFTPIAGAIDAALAGLRDPADASVTQANPNGGEALDALSLSGWLDSIGARGPVRTLLEVAYTIEYGLEPDETSCLNLLFLASTSTTRFEIFGDSDERYHARDGNDVFVRELAARLDPAQLERGAALVAIRGRPAGYTPTFARGATRFDVAADHVVLALPFTRLREVDLRGIELRPAKRLAIARLGYGSNAKLMLGFDGKPWRAAGSNGETFTDLGFQATWDTSRLQPGEQGILTNFTGGAAGHAAGRGTPAAQAASFLAGFEHLVPGASRAANGKVARFHWPSYPHTHGSYSAYRVGQYTTIAGVEGLAENGGTLHFCGEHTSLEAQGYMEGGAATGAAVAAAIVASTGAVKRRRA